MNGSTDRPLMLIFNQSANFGKDCKLVTASTFGGLVGAKCVLILVRIANCLLYPFFVGELEQSVF